SPHGCEQIVGPVNLARLRVEAMQETTEVRFVNQSILDGWSRDRATNLVVMPDEAGLGDVAALGGVDAVHVAHAFAVFGILAIRDVNVIVVNDGSADQLVARLGPNRLFRVRVKLPEL